VLQLKLQQDKFAYEKAQDAAAKAAIAKKKAAPSYSSKSYKKKLTNDEKKTSSGQIKGGTGNTKYDAYDALNDLIASGASKDKISNQISLALREGEITKAEATKLRNTFTPRGIQY